MPRSGMRADLISGLVLTILGAVVVVESWRMPRFEHLGMSVYSAPGLVPAMLGVVLGLMGAMLGLRAARAGAYRVSGMREALLHLIRLPDTRRGALVLSITLLYAGVLVAWVTIVPFWLATGLFVTAFIVLFEWHEARQRKRLARLLAMALMQGVLVAAIVTLIFEKIFMVRLP